MRPFSIRAILLIAVLLTILTRGVLPNTVFALQAVASSDEIGKAADSPRQHDAASATSQTPLPPLVLPARSDFEEPVQPLATQNDLSEAERDRRETLALFSTGRAMELRGRAGEALRHYQRAFFYEPSSKAAAEAVVRLAEELGQEDVRLRYLMRWAKLAPTELPSEIMVDLMDSPPTAVCQTRLVRVLQMLVQEREKSQLRSPGDLLLYWRLAEMLASRDEFDAAADAAENVVRALEDPESFGLRADLAEQIESRSTEALAQFADLFVEVGRTDQAERLYRQVNDRQPNPIWLDLRLASVEVKREHPEVALKLLEPVLENPPADECFLPFTTLADAYKQLGREAELTAKLESLRQKFPEHVPLLCFLGEHYLEKKEYDRAQEAFLASLKFQPTRTALVGIGEIGLLTGDPTPWLGFLVRQFEACGNSATMTEQVDRVANDPKLLDQTLKAAQQILRDTPDRLGQYGPLATAVIALRGDRFDQVELLLPLVEAATPDEVNQLLLCWGTLLFDEGRYDEAAKVFLKGLERGAQGEEYASLEYFLAAALEMAGETERAVAAIERAIAADPTSARLLYQKAWIWFHAKQNEQAKQAFKEFLTRTEKVHNVPSTRLLVAESRQVLAHLASLAGNVEEAEEQLLTVLDEFPNDASAKNDLAFLWAKRGVNLQKSLRLAQDAVQTSPEDATYRDTLGWTYFQLGQADRAIEELRRAVELNPDSKEISDHLKQVLEFSGKSN